MSRFTLILLSATVATGALAAPSAAAKRCVPMDPQVIVVAESGKSVIYFRGYRYVACERGVGKRVAIGYENGEEGRFVDSRYWGVTTRFEGRYAFLAVKHIEEETRAPVSLDMAVADLRRGRPRWRLQLADDFPDADDVYGELLGARLRRRGRLTYSARVAENTEIWRVSRSAERRRIAAGPNVDGDLTGIRGRSPAPALRQKR
jgi:hypothetical protein